MKKIQARVVTMRQKNDDIVDKMNLRCDVIVANQADWDGVTERITDSGSIKMVTTQTRGVGLNRNIALQASDAEILLFADDDMVYYDGKLQEVYEEFQKNPAADMIVFGVDILKNGQITERRRNKPGRVHLWQALKYGTYALAVRSEAVRRADIRFNLLFGGGTVYGSGEDTIFIRECFRKGLRMYGSAYVLGTCCKDASSWFHGYDAKFFFDKGALYACAFPRMKYLVSLYFSFKFAKKASESPFEIYRKMLHGITAYRKNLSYGEYTKTTKLD